MPYSEKYTLPHYFFCNFAGWVTALNPLNLQNLKIFFNFHFIELVPNAKQTIKDAMYEWESKTCIRFSPRETEKDYVEFAMNYG